VLCAIRTIEKAIKLNPILKNIALLVLGSDPMVRRKLKAIKEAGALTILSLHRVSEDDGSAYRPLKPKLFEELLTFLTANFEIITFADMATPSLSDRPKVILSFDDGYKDFIDVAVPILEKYKIFVNQNIIPECVEQKLPPLNVLAQDFVGTAPLSLLLNLRIPDFDVRRFNGNRFEIGLKLSAFLKSRPFGDQQKLREELLPQFYKFDGFRPTPMMSREDIRELATVHEFGAHSYSHASMEYESESFFQQDLARCRNYFRDILKMPMPIYALPNGSYRKGNIQHALDFGYSHVLLVGDRFSQCNNHIHNRFGFHAQSRREVLFRAVGGLRVPETKMRGI